MALEFTRGGRKVSQQDFMRGLEQDVMDQAMSAYADELHGKASSVVDPETGKHATVIVRQHERRGWTILTSGSTAFAKALEVRLGISLGEVHRMDDPINRKRLVYLAHATEDKAIVKPIAEGLMKRGIEVWYDNWEISAGDSLRRKMEAGLEECTHFVVLLTSKSVQKAWVNEEIDVGFTKAVEGSARFIGLRHELPIQDLSPFMQTRLVPELTLGDDGIEELAGTIFGVSKKPPLGDKPQYIQEREAGSTWSMSATVVAEYFVRSSEHAQSMEPMVSYEQIRDATGLSMVDVRIGLLDLSGAGLIDKREMINSGAEVWPKEDLFYTFDAQFMDWDPEKDASKLAAYLLNLDQDYATSADAASGLGWEARRFNPAASYLVAARVIEPIRESFNSDFVHGAFTLGDELLRFVRSQ